MEALEHIKTHIIIETEIKVNQELGVVNPYYNDYEIILQALQRLEAIDNAEPNEAMECLESLRKSANTFCQHMPEQCELNKKYADTIKQALLKAQYDKDIFVIYCSNNYHNYYMDYKGELTPFKSATLFDDELEAHKFLREHSGNKYDNWLVVNVKNLDDSRKCWNK